MVVLLERATKLQVTEADAKRGSAGCERAADVSEEKKPRPV
jgi:hypothetical protein